VARSDLAGVDAVVLTNHGLFTFADDADTALGRHFELVRRAEDALGVRAGAWGEHGPSVVREGDPKAIASLRTSISEAAGRPFILRQSDSSRAFKRAQRDDLTVALGRGTATPEHAIH